LTSGLIQAVRKKTAGAILPSAKHDWLNWSYDKFGQHDCLS